MPQNADEPTVNDELDPQNLDPQAGDADPAPQGDAADTNPPPAPPAQPAHQQRQQEIPAPVYQPPERIVRARQGIDKLDEHLGANGQLKETLTPFFDYQEQLASENAALRVQVAQQGEALGGMGFWQEHDLNPENKDYPSSEARNDYLRIRQEVAEDPYYAGYDDNTRKIAQQIAARERFQANLSQRRSGASGAAAPNNQQETEPAQQQRTTQTTQVRTVGRTRVVPRSTQSVAPAPARHMTVEEMILQNKLPPDVEKQLDKEFKEMAGRNQ